MKPIRHALSGWPVHKSAFILPILGVAESDGVAGGGLTGVGDFGGFEGLICCAGGCGQSEQCAHAGKRRDGLFRDDKALHDYYPPHLLVRPAEDIHDKGRRIIVSQQSMTLTDN